MKPHLLVLLLGFADLTATQLLFALPAAQQSSLTNSQGAITNGAGNSNSGSVGGVVNIGSPYLGIQGQTQYPYLVNPVTGQMHYPQAQVPQVQLPQFSQLQYQQQFRRPFFRGNLGDQNVLQTKLGLRAPWTPALYNRQLWSPQFAHRPSGQLINFNGAITNGGGNANSGVIGGGVNLGYFHRSPESSSVVNEGGAITNGPGNSNSGTIGGGVGIGGPFPESLQFPVGLEQQQPQGIQFPQLQPPQYAPLQPPQYPPLQPPQYPPLQPPQYPPLQPPQPPELQPPQPPPLQPPQPPPLQPPQPPLQPPQFGEPTAHATAIHIPLPGYIYF